jgi:sugar phosphate isomerase/epimerase
MLVVYAGNRVEKLGWKEGQRVLIIGIMNNPQLDLLAEIAWAHANRFEFLDLTLEPSGAHPRQVKVKQTRRALKNANLDIIGHTAYYLPLASPFETLRKAALKEMGSTLEVFAELGASKVTVHPDKSIPFALGSKGVWEKNVESLEAIESMAAPLGIQILLENMDRTFNTVDQIRDALLRMPGLGFHLDVAHANLNVEKNRTEEFLKAFRDRLVHVHLSDNFGKSEDLHLPLRAGTIPWPKIIGLLTKSGYDGTITLEIFSPDRRYLLLSRDILRQLWEKKNSADG